MLKRKLLVSAMAAAFLGTGLAHADTLTISSPTTTGDEPPFVFASEILSKSTGAIPLGELTVDLGSGVDASFGGLIHTVDVSLSGGAELSAPITDGSFNQTNCDFAGTISGTGGSLSVTNASSGDCTLEDLTFNVEMPNGSSAADQAISVTVTPSGGAEVFDDTLAYATFEDAVKDITIVKGVDQNSETFSNKISVGTVQVDAEDLLARLPSAGIINADSIVDVTIAGAFKDDGDTFISDAFLSTLACDAATPNPASGFDFTRADNEATLQFDGDDATGATLLGEELNVCLKAGGESAALDSTYNLTVEISDATETFDAFPITESGDLATISPNVFVAGASTRIWNVPKPESAAVAQIRIYNTSTEELAIALNLVDANGDVVCDQDEVTDTVPVDGFLRLSSDDIADTCGVTTWAGRAFGEVLSSDNAEVQNLLRDANGILTNFSAVGEVDGTVD